jgi:hypothetical protein
MGHRGPEGAQHAARGSAEPVTVSSGRRHRRLGAPAIWAVFGLVIGTLSADVVVLSLLGESLLSTAWSFSVLTDPRAWLEAIAALHDPAVAVVSLGVGGLPGALIGHRLAVRRRRRDRVEGLLRDASAY